MKNQYEAIIVLNTQGREESVDKIISQIGRDIEAEGAKLKQIDQLGRKKFAYNPHKVDDGFYVNYQFETAPADLDKVRTKLKLNPAVFLQHYQKLS
jgi:small subunit ribosomal protein S6